MEFYSAIRLECIVSPESGVFGKLCSLGVLTGLIGLGERAEGDNLWGLGDFLTNAGFGEANLIGDFL